jgi:twitching motility protein PilT
LRQAPKVILVGEMRDMETTEIALEAAETGHLVLSTLHTIDASKTVARILGIFPKSDEQQIRTRFAQTFKWIVSQRLVPKVDGSGRLACCEILRSTERTRDYIQNGEAEGRSLTDAMNDGFLDGMQTFDMELLRHYKEGTIAKEVAISFATNAPNLALKMSGIADSSSEMGKSLESFQRPKVAPEEPAKKKGIGAFGNTAPPPPEAPKAASFSPIDADVGADDLKSLLE